MKKNFEPLFSIVVPVYNAASYIEECVKSLQNQSYKNIEIILVDDGSTDNSLALSRKFEASDKRVKVFHQTNKGQGSARNVGIDKANGDYFLFVDSDDTISEDVISSNLQLLIENPDLDFVQFPVHMMYGTDKAYITERSKGLYTEEDDFRILALKDAVISWIVCDKIFRSSLFSNRRFREDIKYEDNYFIMQLLPDLSKVFVSDKGLYYYFHRDNSTTTSSTSLLKENSTREVLVLTLNQLMDAKYSPLFYKYLVRLINVEKSLRKNFGQKLTEENNRKEINLFTLFNAGLSFKDLIKVLFYKISL